jgi:hypothetical protein
MSLWLVWRRIMLIHKLALTGHTLSFLLQQRSLPSLAYLLFPSHYSMAASIKALVRQAAIELNSQNRLALLPT